MAKAKKQVLRWKFGDTYVDQPLEQHEEQLLRQAVTKASGEDPVLRTSGEGELKQRASRLATEARIAAKRAKTTEAAAAAKRAKAQPRNPSGKRKAEVGERQERRLRRGK